MNDIRVEVQKNLQTAKEMENVLASLINNELEGPDKFKTGLNYNLGVFQVDLEGGVPVLDTQNLHAQIKFCHKIKKAF